LTSEFSAYFSKCSICLSHFTCFCSFFVYILHGSSKTLF